METLDQIQAKKQVDRFVRRFDDSYRSLLYHASLPLVLTPELLHYIRNSFLRGQVLWIAEIDLLLSDLCHKVGYELYAIDTSVRAYCLDEMRKTFGQKRMQEIASLLIKYLRYLSQGNSFISKQELQSQKWAALVYLDNENKREVASEIAASFASFVKPSLNSIEPTTSIINQNELYQLSLITKELAPQLDRYPQLIQCAEEIHSILTSTSKIATSQITQHLSQMKEIGDKINDVPNENVSIFEFETVKVDETGQIIKRYKKQAKQYIEDLGNGIKLEMVEIPGGEFMMGTSESDIEKVIAEYYRYGVSGEDARRWVGRETPQHKVKVPAFYMGKFQVTQAQWRAIMGNNPSYFKRDDNLPVEQVSWDDAIEFCKKLSEKTGKKYCLPSEAEWEYACRAGSKTVFAFGGTITPDIVNYNGNYPYGKAPQGSYRAKTIPVGSLGVANEFGLYDMHGNVWEWCQDTFQDSYINAPVDGSAWEIKSRNYTYQVLRGSSWGDNSDGCRAAFRLRSAPGYSYNYCGLRVVLVAQTFK